MRHTLLIAALLCAAVPTFSAAPAWAQDDIARASQLLASANAAYSAGNFRAALDDYRASYNLTKDDRVLYRIGLCYENLSNYQRAREHLELYLLADPNTQYKDRIDAKLVTLRELEATMQAFLMIHTDPPGGRIWVNREVDGPPVGVAPARIPVGPGTHTVVVRIGDREVVDRVNVAQRQTVERTYRADGPVETPPTTTNQPNPDQPKPVQPKPVQPQPVQPQPQAPTEQPPEPAELRFEGELTKVSLIPSNGLNVLGWSLTTLGAISGLAVVGMFAFNIDPGAGANVGLLSAAGILSVAGMLVLWVPNDTRHLPPAPARVQHDIAPQRAVGVSVRF